MDRDDSLGLGRDCSFHLRWVNVEGPRVHVDQDGGASNIGDWIDCCCPGHSGGYDLASLLDMVRNGVVGENRESEEVCRGTRVHHHSMSRTVVIGEGLFELLDLGSHCHPC